MQSETSFIQNSFAVSFSYPVIFTDDALAPANSALREIVGGGRFCAFIDSGLAAARPSIGAEVEAYFSGSAANAAAAGAISIVAGGASVKNDPEILRGILETLANARLDRQSFVLAIGGGSILDAVGLAAALFHRGMRLVRMPTTVLAQADAGVGVKNGVDFLGQKNLLGAFAPPFAVLCDRGIVETLPRAEMLAGLSECVKVGVIRDAEFFASLEDGASALAQCGVDAIARAVEGAARIHLRQITTGGDPFEYGSARPLDFGHWAAHRIEVISQKRVGHGTAVAAGMALDSVYASLAGILQDSDCQRILALLRKLGLPTFLPELEAVDSSGGFAVLRGLADFREHLGGELCVTLPTAIGRTIEVNSMDESLIRRAVAILKGNGC